MLAARFERATYRLGGDCSIQLSYASKIYAKQYAISISGIQKISEAPFTFNQTKFLLHFSLIFSKALSAARLISRKGASRCVQIFC